MTCIHFPLGFAFCISSNGTVTRMKPLWTVTVAFSEDELGPLIT